MSTQLNFPKTHYCGIVMNRSSHGGNRDNLPLGFITPYGEDSSAKKRMATVDAWVSSNCRYDDSVPTKTVIKNTPMGGFCLLDAVVRSSRYNTSVKFRIEDPRGFELEISAHNLMMIMRDSVIDKGEILDMCVWGRDGSENVLVPVSSPQYSVMEHNSARMSKSASLKDMNAGDTVVMHNGYEGRYIGKFHEIDYNYNSKHDSVSYKYFSSPKKKWVFLRDGVVKVLASAPKISEIFQGEPIEIEEGLRMLNNLKDRKYMFSMDKELSSDFHIAESTQKAVEDQPYYSANQWHVVKHDDAYWTVKKKYGNNGFDLTKINTDGWENHKLISYEQVGSVHNNYWGRTYYSNVTTDLTSLAGLDIVSRTTTLTLSNGDILNI
jgi:hypothetical protein